MTRDRREQQLRWQAEFASPLMAPADQVWAHVTDFAGINAEMRPLLRMTAPHAWRNLTPENIHLGHRLFRSWLLLFGLFPIDYDDLTIVEFGPGHRFLERSQMFSASVWEHERVVELTGADSCRVIDRVRFTPRWRPLGLVLGWFVPRFFLHRHRQLRRAFGDRST
ncbi:MAG: hypothetical protein M3422_25545 [Actinomycetota bacterium]|nr:hypothetical protein [Actinomycetota bacterium]